MADSNSESGSITLKLIESPSPRFAITCKNMVDFFDQFKKKCQDLGVHLKDIIWTNDDNEPATIANAMAFADSMLKSGYTRRLYVRKCSCNKLSSNWDEIGQGSEATELENPNEETKRASVKLVRSFAPPLHIQYKDKQDLYEKFKQRMQQLNLSLDDVFWRDIDNECQSFIDADDLYDTVRYRAMLTLFIRQKSK